MRSIPKQAFGYVVFVTECDAGEERTVDLTNDGYNLSGHYFYTKGRVKNYVIETGEQLEDRVAGWLNTEHPEGNASTSGTVQDIYIEDSQWLCIPHRYNDNKLPTLQSLILESEQSQILPNGTDLYLVRGKLNINGKLFVGPTQIRVRSGDVTAISIDDTSYSLKFL